jgi:hypothetical protein
VREQYSAGVGTRTGSRSNDRRKTPSFSSPSATKHTFSSAEQLSVLSSAVTVLCKWVLPRCEPGCDCSQSNKRSSQLQPARGAHLCTSDDAEPSQHTSMSATESDSILDAHYVLREAEDGAHLSIGERSGGTDDESPSATEAAIDLPMVIAGTWLLVSTSFWAWRCCGCCLRRCCFRWTCCS